VEVSELKARAKKKRQPMIKKASVGKGKAAVIASPNSSEKKLSKLVQTGKDDLKSKHLRELVEKDTSEKEKTDGLDIKQEVPAKEDE